MQTIVLSGNVRETYAWADAKGRHRRSVKHVPNATALQGRAYDEVVELPSFSKRPDRHAVLAAVKRLKRSRPDIEHIVDSEWVTPERPKKVEPVRLAPSVFLFSNVPASPAPVAANVTAHETFDVVQPVKAEAEAKYDAIEAISNLGEDAAESTQRPKRRGRRTNEQKAYDEALAAWETNGGTAEAVREARKALLKRHPDDERLEGDVPDLDF